MFAVIFLAAPLLATAMPKATDGDEYSRTVVLDTGDKNTDPVNASPSNVFSMLGGTGMYYSKCKEDGVTFMKQDLRSGSPHSDTGLLQIKDSAVGEGDYLIKVTFTWRYGIGYCDQACDEGKENPEAGFELAPSWDNGTSIVLWDSGEVPGEGANGAKYSYNAGGYSPPRQVTINYINLYHPAEQELFASLSFKNNDRNLQIPLVVGTGLNMTLYYAPRPIQNPANAKQIGVTVMATTMVAFVLYLITGAIINQKKHDLHGMASLPHKTFWKSLPGLAKDGLVFSWYTLRRKMPSSIVPVSSTYDSL